MNQFWSSKFEQAEVIPNSTTFAVDVFFLTEQEGTNGHTREEFADKAAAERRYAELTAQPVALATLFRHAYKGGVLRSKELRRCEHA